MIINHNISAMNTYRQLSANNVSQNKSLEKLSSGFRINRAGDDAAGLAISEKMRAQIRGLNQASRNAQDGISLIQTAEGALSESHAILQRMRELAVQGATDTNTSDDRQKIQAEVDQLAGELTRIANTAEFNTRNLLAGGLKTIFHIGANQGQNVNATITAMDAFSLGVAGKLVSAGTFTDGSTGISGVGRLGQGLKAETYTVTTTRTGATAEALSKAGGLQGAAGTLTGVDDFTGDADTTLQIRISALGSVVTAGATGVTETYKATEIQWRLGADNWTTVAIDSADNAVLAGTGLTWAAANGTGYTAADAATGTERMVATTLTASKYTAQLKDAGGNNVGHAVEFRYSATEITVGDVSIGETMRAYFEPGEIVAGSATQVVAHVDSKRATLDGSGAVVDKAFVAKGIDISSQRAADRAITTINSALENVSEQRAMLGAAQNRLEHTIANLDTSAENLQASEARIRDVDMAQEMMEFTKLNILSQAATAMLAQANQQPQMVLQLLR